MAVTTAFQRAFALLAHRRGESFAALSRALVAEGCIIDRGTLRLWALGAKTPAHARSFAALAALERRWGLPQGYFRAMLPSTGRAVRAAPGSRLAGPERRRLAWHLPEDFELRAPAEQAEILTWVRRVMGTGATGYRRYLSAKVRDRFRLCFPSLPGGRLAAGGGLTAPAALQAEVAELVAYKTALLAPPGYVRRTAWGAATAAQKVEHLGLVFGALAAPVEGPLGGLGVPSEALRLGLLTFPAAWDGYLEWRLRRRGFYTCWEEDLLKVAASLAHPETGWFPQRPDLAGRLAPAAGLASDADIAAARTDWAGHCGRLRRFALERTKELRQLARTHNDPFEPILPVLEAERPVAEYRKIAEEALRLRPDPRLHPIAAAEALRAFLMIRLGLHLGFRQRNLRELLFAPKGAAHRTEPELAHLRRGELRWDLRRRAWQVFAPAAAFKNAGSRFFSGGPFVLELPDLAGLYAEIDAWLATHRQTLLGPAVDPGTFFVKTCTRATRDAAYGEAAFYQAWRTIVCRYGVYNPWTGHGAIAGLLPHGPQSVRDVLATHVIKRTGSFEHASYAIQDTPETLVQHYARFLPRQKAAIAARVLNAEWSD